MKQENSALTGYHTLFTVYNTFKKCIKLSILLLSKTKFILAMCGVYRVLQFPPEGWLRMSIGHCGITWVTIRPNGRVSVRSMGDTGHLPADQLSL